MSTCYDDDFKREVVKAYMAGGRSLSQISAQYNVVKSTISKWAGLYGEECQYITKSKESDAVKKIRRLNQELHEKEKERAFLKKAAAFFAKEID